MAELDLVSSPRRMHRDRKRNLQQLVLLLPVDIALEPEHARASVEHHPLRETRGSKLTGEPHSAPQSTGHLDVLSRKLDQIDPVLHIVDVYVPRVPTRRIVIVKLQEVAARACGEDLAPGLLVPDRGQKTMVVPAHPKKVVLHLAVGDNHDLVLRNRGAILHRPTAPGSLEHAESIAK